MIFTKINWDWIYAYRVLIQIKILNTILKTPIPKYFIISMQGFSMKTLFIFENTELQ